MLLYFTSSINNREYEIEITEKAIWLFIDHTNLIGNTAGWGFKYNIETTNIYWYGEPKLDIVDDFVPNDLREHCQKIVKDIILL